MVWIIDSEGQRTGMPLRRALRLLAAALLRAAPWKPHTRVSAAEVQHATAAGAARDVPAERRSQR